MVNQSDNFLENLFENAWELSYKLIPILIVSDQKKQLN